MDGVKTDPIEHVDHRWATVPEAMTLMKFDSNRQALHLFAKSKKLS